MNPQDNTFRLARASEQGLEWTLRRNCSVTPKQLALVYAALCALSLAIAAFFWFMGAAMVLPFALLELIAVATAFLVFARHANDAERVRLVRGSLVVEQETAGVLRRNEFPSERVRVMPLRSVGELIELQGAGSSVWLGRHVRAELRPLLAREMRTALQTWSGHR